MKEQESVGALARRYGISLPTVQKQRKRTSVPNQPMGPVEPHSAVLTVEREAMIVVAFRRYTLLPLNNCLYGLQPTFPTLTRLSLHRCH